MHQNTGSIEAFLIKFIAVAHVVYAVGNDTVPFKSLDETAPSPKTQLPVDARISRTHFPDEHDCKTNENIINLYFYRSKNT
jgi:hypothetical protein